jgi:hypothetical protein
MMKRDGRTVRCLTARNERLHTGQDIVRALQARFDTRLLTEGPYFSQP